jgi:Fe-S cluster biogenesis protein NfuA
MPMSDPSNNKDHALGQFSEQAPQTTGQVSREGPGEGPGEGSGRISSDIKERVSRVIQLIRPAVQEDNGDVELVEVTDEGVVKVRFHGECRKCPSRPLTLTHDIETNIKAQVPQVTAVVEVD